ncbi:hypothetical protein E9531_17320, partial [Lampropedia puyangensis]
MRIINGLNKNLQHTFKAKGVLKPHTKLLGLCSAGMLGLATLIMPLGAKAQNNVLFVSSNESSNPGWNAYIANARNAFDEVAPAGTFVNRTGGLSGTTSLTSDIANAKLLVLTTVCSSTNPDRWDEVQAALETRPDLMVIGFVDGSNAGDCPTHLSRVTDAINAIKPDTWSTIKAETTLNELSAPLNQQSLYASTFQSVLPSIVGGWWGRMSPIPTDYALYTQVAVASPAPPTVSDAYGLFIPQAASNAGKGACLFFVADTSQFSNTIGGGGLQPTQSNNIAKAFYAAATDPAG